MWDITIKWEDADWEDPETGTKRAQVRIAGSQHAGDPLDVIAEALETPPREGMTVQQIIVVNRPEPESRKTPLEVWNRVGWFDASDAVVGAKEIAEMFDRSRQWAVNVTKRRSFPEPVATLACGPVWDRGAIEAYRQGLRQEDEDVL